MAKGDRRTARKPATKFPNLLKKLQKQQTPPNGPRYFQPRKPRSIG
jgi:hypothetical protein